ncbi:MAG: hypothetical protein KBT41_02475 [bacterium]|nr:hypothetical protein [Candidatus Colousia faecequi]
MRHLSTYSSPVGGIVLDFGKGYADNLILVALEIRVKGYYFLCLVTCHIEYIAISGKRGNVKVEGETTLLQPLHVARTTKTHIILCNHENDICFAHNLETLERLTG